MKEIYSIAVDGPSGAGKSSLARRCASAFGFIYVDTGAIYRCVGLAAYRKGIDRKDAGAVSALLPELEIKIAYDDKGEQRMYLNGEDVSREIREPHISLCASDVSAIPQVRAFLLEMQRKMAEENSVIMDGRDIGTVVLPNAQLKIFLTASPEARAERRMLELKEKGVEQSFEEVLEEINQRDRKDSCRETAPLREAEDAIHVDTSKISFEESFEVLCGIIEQKLHIKRLEKRK